MSLWRYRKISAVGDVFTLKGVAFRDGVAVEVHDEALERKLGNLACFDRVAPPALVAVSVVEEQADPDAAKPSIEPVREIERPTPRRRRSVSRGQ